MDPANLAPNGASPSTPAAPGQAAATPPAGQPAAPVSTPVVPAAGQPQAQPGWRNVDEIKAALKQTREMAAGFEQLLAASGSAPEAPKAAPAKGEAAAPTLDQGAIAAQATAAAMFEMGMSTAGLTDVQAALVRTAFKAEMPAPAAMAAWMKGKLEAFGKGGQVAATPPAQSGIRTDLGAPGAGPVDPNALPTDPRMIDPAVWRGLSSEQRLGIMRKNAGGSGLMRNPNRK